jgi:hypothetical protein
MLDREDLVDQLDLMVVPDVMDTSEVQGMMEV